MCMYCTVLYNLVPKCTVNYIFHKTVYYRHFICRFHGFWGQETHFWTQNDTNVYLLYSTLQLCVVMYSRVQYSTVFHKTVNYSHITCHFHGFGGQGTHFWTQIDAIVNAVYSTVQFCTIMYSKIHFFTKQLTTGMLYVISRVFGVTKLIYELKMTLMFLYCIKL